MRGRYIEGYAWWQVAREAGYTEKWARDKGGRALRDVALMVLGVSKKPIQIALAL